MSKTETNPARCRLINPTNETHGPWSLFVKNRPVRIGWSVFVALSLLVAQFQIAAAQPTGLRINEFMASNVSTHPDNADFDDYSDWIELHNPTQDPIDLDYYYLTDNLTAPVKWPIPLGTTIPANGFLVIRADDANTGPGGEFLREFSPWDKFTNIYHHANFKLSAEGEDVGLFRFDGEIQQVDLVTLGSDWKYWDEGTDPGELWSDSSFDDTSWPEGPAELGYGDGDEETEISYGDDADKKYPAYYFRKTFGITNTNDLAQIELRLLADDGAIVYLNGAQVLRVRMPEGDVDFETHALGLSSEGVFDSTNIAPSLLLLGDNLLAVEVHQRSDTSSDISFDLELTAKRLVGDAVIVDSVSYGQQYPDVAWGRNPNDDGNWYYFGEPTSGAANTTIPTLTPVPSSVVEFSIANGFYETQQNVVLTTSSGAAAIHYTLDGSSPHSSSPAYSVPIPITTTTVVRARTFEPGKLPGPIVTKTYFINEPERDLPVVSFVVNPDEFFDSTLGIYTNVYKGREAAVHLEFFDEERELGFAVNAGSKIAGENIWRFAQKPLTVTMRGKYGDDLINYQLFPNERIGSFGQIVFRNGGDNWPNAMLRDAMTPHVLRGQSDSDVQNYRPCVVYMNGEYWGIHNIREKLDDQYFATHHHINSGTYDYLEFGHVIGGAVALLVSEGDADDYNSLVDFAETNDLAQAEYYGQVEARMDMDSFVDFVAAEDFVYNSSWRHNREFWRERKPDAKWHWVVPDLDRGFNAGNINLSLLDNMTNSFPLFRELAKNANFRNNLAQRYSAHINSTFHPQRISDILDVLDAEVLPEMPRHIAKWASENGIQSLSARQDELDEIKQFAADRERYVRAGISNYLHLSSTAELTINIVPPNAGRVTLHGVPLLPEYSSTAKMYRDIPLRIEIEPAPGFEFDEWSDGLGNDQSIDITINADQTLTATFVVSPETIIPAVIDSDLTLTFAGSPYTSEGSVIVEPGVTLTVEPGVVIKLPELADLTVKGALNINGEENNPVSIEARSASRPWGVVAFLSATGDSVLSHLIIRDASVGAEPVNLKAAISNMGSNVEIVHADIESAATIFARGGSTILRSSRIYSPFTGDGINIKDGAGLVEDSTFIGNNAPDTDAIDFDGVVDGVIQRNRILAFRGFNSDGIDVGEGCVNLLISGNLIYNNSDKGISVGQGSEVRIERNLIVGCVLGVGIKDTGSIAYIDQNTFANNDIGVAVFEKNLDAGGGEAVVSNNIFSRTKKNPVTADAKSTATVTFSLSDTLPIPGTGNLVDDPLFTDPASYDFSLQENSPAINVGDPAHAPDPDESQADIGAYYVFDPGDYPFRPPNLVVINEILAHSHDEAPDWIELFNNSAVDVDIGGWYLSDSKSNRMKYRIADNTILAGNGYLVFYEDTAFGLVSSDPGKIEPFALSENGESVFLFAPGDELILDYLEEEAFGASNTGVSEGRHFKESSNTYNFVSMATPTPGAANSLPLVGPISISEIMYHPPVNAAAEYIELVNISGAPVTLYDELVNEPWRFTDGIEFVFPSQPKVTMAAGERILIVRNESVFNATYTVPPGTQIFQWTDGGLSNTGEKLELSEPGDVDAELVRHYIRIDRVSFNDKQLWPAGADGLGYSLTRLNDSTYGNDVANWIAAQPTPGSEYIPPEGGFVKWAQDNEVRVNESGANDDPDEDGLVNLLEYVFGLSPTVTSTQPLPVMTLTGDTIEVIIPLTSDLSDVNLTLLKSTLLTPTDWEPVPGFVIEPAGDGQQLRATVSALDPEMFFQLKIEMIQ